MKFKEVLEEVMRFKMNRLDYLHVGNSVEFQASAIQGKCNKGGKSDGRRVFVT